jgi:hypothetical protein
MPRALIHLVLALAIAGCSGPPPGAQQNAGAPGSASAGQAQPVPAATAESSGVSAVFSVPRRNSYLQLAATEAGFDSRSPAPPPGQRYYTVGLRGTSVSRADFVLEVRPFTFAQNERGCISRADPSAAWLARPLGPTAVFAADKPTEGQISFLVPEDTQRIRVLIAPAQGDSLAAPAGEAFQPAWPAPIRTIEDGTTLRVLVLPPLPVPAKLGDAPAGHKYVLLDFVIENLKNTQGIEFATSQQLRLVDARGGFVQPSALTQQIGCRLDDGDVIPPGQSRRFNVAYEIPAGTPLRVQYRGFEVEEASVDLE